MQKGKLIVNRGLLVLFLLLVSMGKSYGAELLVKAIDATHRNTVKDKAGCYKRGDPVVAMKDGHEWGKEERLPKFFVIKLPGISVKDAGKYIESDWDYTDPDNPVLVIRRKYRIKIDDAPFKDELNSTGETTVTWDEIKGFIENKETGVTE